MPEAAFDLDKYIAEKGQATAQANTFDMDKYLAEKSKSAAPTYGPDMQSAAVGLQSGLNTMTLGAANPMISALTADYNTIKNKFTGKGDLSIDDWKKNYQADIDQTRAATAAHPVASTVGSVAGALNPSSPAAAVAGKVSGLIGSGAKAVGGLIPDAIASSGLGSLAGRVATGAAQGYGTAVGLEAPRQAIEGATGFIKKGDKDVPDLNSVGKMGAIVGGGIPLAGAAASAAMSGGKKLAATFFGPSENHIQYYLDNPDAVNNAPSMPALKEKLDSVTERLRDDVDQGKVSVTEAQNQLDDINKAAQEHRKDSTSDFKRTSFEIKRTVMDAKKDLGSAFKDKVNELKSVKAPTDLADETNQAVKDLKDKVIQGSQDATAKINPDSTVQGYSPYKILQDAQARLDPAGLGPITPEAKAAHDSIEGLKKTFGSIGASELTGKQAKGIIQQLDQSQKALYEAGQFSGPVPMAYKQLRAELDQQLKAGNPEYAEAMKPVAADTGLHSDVANKFGDRQSAISSLNSIGSPTAQVNRENLSKLGQATGRDFDTPVQKYMDAQGLLKDDARMTQLRQGLPEYQQMLEAEKANDLVSHPDAAKEYADRSLQDSGLLKQKERAEGLLAQRQEGLIGAQDRAVAAKGLTPQTSQNRLETAGRGLGTDKEKIEAIGQLRELSKMSDTDFVKAIQDRATNNAFKGQDINGSRKVNLFAIMAGGVAGAGMGMLGHGLDPAVMAGAASAGASLGAVSDKYGPAMTKAMLNLALKIQGSPTLAKIQALAAQPQVKAALAKELADYNQPEKK